MKAAELRETDCKECANGANTDFDFTMTFQPQLLKLDMSIDVIDIREERDVLRDKGINKFQGYYFARPAIKHLPAVNFVS